MFFFSEKMSIFAANYSAILMRTIRLITIIIATAAVLVIAACANDYDLNMELEVSKAETHIYQTLLIGTLLICMLIGYLLWRSHKYNSILVAENRKLYAEIEQKHEEQQQKTVQMQETVQQKETIQMQEIALQETVQQKETVQLEVAPVEELSNEQLLYRRICTLMDEEKPYTEETLNRDALAQMLNTNTKYVELAIRQCSKGDTVNDFINRYRLENVARLLKTTNDPIAIIGELSGIPSRATLARLFRNAYGMTPSEYRNTTPKS